MPKYDTMHYKQTGLRVSLSPKGWRGRLKCLIPYLSGDTLDIEIHTVSSHAGAQQYKYEWQLQEFLPD